ncbi:MAG: MBL fold metallo-hydrolase [Treponema sp.]|nr:MBL fold metallo-hydrolase [Treponema sp.]
MKLIDVVVTGPMYVNSCVVHLVGSKVFITDPACCSRSKDEAVLTDYLDERQLEPVAVLLTHGHFDHVSGLKSIKKRWPELPVFIHEADSACIGHDSAVEQGKALALARYTSFLPECSDLPEADGFLCDGQTLGELPLKDISSDTKDALNKWKVLSTPGHTRGSVCLYNAEEKILIAGDTVFYHAWGRTDLPGGSERRIMDSLKKLFRELPPDTKVYPGHEYYGFELRENFNFI